MTKCRCKHNKTPNEICKDIDFSSRECTNHEVVILLKKEGKMGLFGYCICGHCKNGTIQ